MSTDIRVLIADNHREFADMLRDYLEQWDDIQVVGIALDGWAAYNMIHEKSPDIVVLDIIMPQLDGLGVLEKMSTVKMANKPAFIVLSGIGQHDTLIQTVLDLGAAHYMIKPVNMDMLANRIRQIKEQTA